MLAWKLCSSGHCVTFLLQLPKFWDKRCEPQIPALHYCTEDVLWYFYYTNGLLNPEPDQ